MCVHCLKEHPKAHKIVTFQKFIEDPVVLPQMNNFFIDDLMLLESQVNDYQKIMNDQCTWIKKAIKITLEERKKNKVSMMDMKEKLLSGTEADLEKFDQLLAKAFYHDDDQVVKSRQDAIERMKKRVHGQDLSLIHI
eukprot:TRINITY_DN6301_c0_g5_i3.p1 TRINITY_DN6301_c0_g5~~TRINITY_DN6301_c0_g5_i3.p1  ORF type:complete len:137 (-),score=28.49 TRINITY_DN6301_c0_g5_i3:4-414(-)